MLYLLVNGYVDWCVYLLHYEAAPSSNTNEILLTRRLIGSLVSLDKLTLDRSKSKVVEGAHGRYVGRPGHHILIGSSLARSGNGTCIPACI